MRLWRKKKPLDQSKIPNPKSTIRNPKSQMSVAYFIARRYIRSNRRRGFLSFLTNFAVLGVTLGTAALIITLSILDGFEREIKTKVVDFTAHIQVAGFQNQPLEHFRNSIERVKRSIAGVRSMSPFAAKEGMIRHKDAVDGVFLKGIDPAEDMVAPGTHIVDGKFLSGDVTSLHEIVVGRKLALKLDAAIGDKVVVFALPQDQTGRPKAMQFQLVGIYESGMAEFDDIYAYTRLTDAQNLFQIGDRVSGYDILVDDITRVDDVAKDIQSLLEYPHYTRTVFQLYYNLFSWVELQKKLSPVLLSLIIIVATINVVGTLLMFVLEKMHAIGVLKSLGAGPKVIRRIFMIQGLGIATAGILFGNLIAYGVCVLQSKFRLLTLPSEIYYMNSVPILIRPENFALVTVIAFVLCMLTTMLPSRAAASLDPVNAMRFG